MRFVSTHQPEVWLRLHMLQRAFVSDVYVFQPELQVVRKWTFHKMRVADRKGQVHVLTVPMVHSGERQLYSEAVVVGTDWTINQRKTLEHLYAKAPYRDQAIDYFNRVVKEWWNFHPGREFWQLAWISHRVLWELLDVPSKLVNEMDYKLTSTHMDREIETTHRSDCTGYITGLAAGWNSHLAEYEKNTSAFSRAGLTIYVQSWKIPEYRTGAAPVSESLSAIDAIAYLGYDGVHRLLAATKREEIIQRYGGF